MIKRLGLTTPAFVAAAMLASPAALALESDSGFYLGGSVGGYTSHGGEFDDDDELAELSGGYQFTDALALQLGYLDFGDFGDFADPDDEASLKGVSLALRVRFPLGDQVGVYGKAGAFASSFDVDAFDESETYDEVDPFVGLGLDYKVSTSLSAFAEYNRYSVEVDNDDFGGELGDDQPDFDTVQVGLRYVF